ncbi:MAG: OmpA family protein [Bacteroidales bacterium]|nr:OmpA family protein [Bacteroidales bacterium]
MTMKIKALILALTTIGLFTIGTESCVSKKKYQEAVAKGKKSLDSLNRVFNKTVEGFNQTSNTMKNANFSKDLMVDSLTKSNKQLNSDKATLNQNLVNTINDYKEERDKLAAKSRTVDSLMNILNLQANIEDSVRNVSDSQLKGLQNLLLSTKKALEGTNQSDAYSEIKGGSILITVNNDFLYKTSTAELSVKGIALMKKISAIFTLNENCRVTVIGNSDNNGQAKTLLELSARRASSVITCFAQNSSLPGTAYTASGRGMYNPITTNDNEANKKKNRRTEIIINPIN